MLRFVCALSALLAVAMAGEVIFKDCGHHEVTKLAADQCGGETCVIHKGKPLELDAEFVANQNTSHIHIALTATVDGLELPIPGVKKDGCEYIKCPLVAGQHYKFTYHLNVPKLLPDIKAEVGAKFTGDHGLLACLTLKGAIQN